MNWQFNLQRFGTTSVVGPLDSNLVQTVWAKELWEATQPKTYWNKFIGEGPDYIISKNTDLTKSAGDIIIIPLIAPLISQGISGDNYYTGNEEPLTPYDFSVTVAKIGNAVLLKGEFDQQLSQLNMRTAAKSGLSGWLANMVIDQGIFNALSTTPSTYRYVYPNGRTATAQVQTTDTMSVALISQAKRAALLAGNPIPIATSSDTGTTAVGSYTFTGGGSFNFTTGLNVGDIISIGTGGSLQTNVVTAITSATVAVCNAQWNFVNTSATYTVTRYTGARSQIRPVKIEGEEMFVVVLHPNQLRDLRNDSDWLNANTSNAAWRTIDNPIFKGGAGVWDNVVVHTHPRVVTGLNGVGNIQTAQALFLGAQAGCMAIAREPDWVEDDTIDYGNKVGFKTSMIWGVQKANFNNQDFGCMQIITAAINDIA